jgi:TPP-dependent pyruvate/acetoin dehydrogenase alpha subunit
MSHAAVPSDTELRRAYRAMYLIRSFEQELPALYRSGVLAGTAHLCSGQEAGTVAVVHALTEDDAVFSNHRGHGHFLALTDDADGLLHELAGDPEGVCGGMGGSQHLHVPGRFYSSGILGGMVATGSGYAASLHLRGETGIAVVFLGDGALGEGVVWESINIAALRRLPVLYVVEDNGVSQSTPRELNLAGAIAPRLEAFGLAVTTLASTELSAVWPPARAAVEAVRAGAGPRAIVFEAPRLAGHSVNSGEGGAGNGAAVPRDPLPLARALLDQADAEAIERDVDARLERLFGARLVGAG